MALWDIFKRKKVLLNQLKTIVEENKNSLSDMKSYISSLSSQIMISDVLLNRHDQLINEQGKVLESHINKVKSLESLVGQSPANRIEACKNKLTENAKNEKLSYKVKSQSANENIEMSRFSHQEKKILSVFFEHPDMALSYKDISRYLQKSPNTIKNQLRQLRMKAEMFNQTVDEGNRNRFRLKDGLRVDKILNLKKTTNETDRSD